CTVGGDSPKMVYSIGKNNEFMIMENEIIYDNAKTKMFMQPYGDYEGTFVVPETINVLQQGQFSHGVYKLKSNITIYEYSKISISLFTTSSYYTYEKKISGIKLHAGITKIPDACFYDCVALQEIDYNGAEIVEFGALSLSNSIRNITFPDSVKIIKDVTGNCPNLESFVFPKNLEQMVYIDFSNSKIKEIIIPALAGAIPSDYLNFQNCLQLEKVVFLYDRVERILSEFNGCINLKVIEGIDHLTNLFGNGCFYNCGLEKLVISKKMEGIWNYDAFAGLYNLREIYIEKGANPMWKVPKHYGMEIMQPDFAFLLQWNKRLERIVVEDGHEIYASDDGVLYKKASKVISELAYYPLGKTDTHFDVYESIEMINANCFINNQYLKTVSMPNVKYLLQSVFEGSVIESINAPKLEYIGNSTFKNCQNLKSFDFSTVKYISENAFANSALESINIVGDAEIRVFAFADCIQLTSVTIGENVPAFAFDLVFFNGAKIKSININNNPNFIYENDVLYNCNKTILYKSLQSDKTINVVEGVIKIGAAAFINNLTLENVVLPTTLKAIGDKAFYGDINLKSVRINSEVAPMLESVYMENEKLQYSNFVGVIGTEMNLTLFHTANISYETPIWKTYFKNHFTVNADGSIEADSINDNSEKTTVDNKQLSKVSNVVAIAANNNFLTVGTLLLILSSFFATVCKIKFN
ncbi:MAG: leucine-rich repeat protein, partial [Clostridia bacterium]